MMTKANLSSLYWYAFLVTAGAASTAAEITGLRLLAPLFGSSLPVWGSAIAIVLGGLAVGYTLGGKRAQRPVEESVVRQRAAAAAILFLWMPAAFYAATLLRNNFLTTGSALSALGAFLESFLSLLPPSILFGMISPLAIQVEATRRGQNAGEVAGRVFTLTTVGSLFGILIPSFLTIPLLGTRETIWLFAGIIFLLSAWPLLTSPGKHARLLALAAGGALMSLLPSQLDSSVVFATETPYQHVTVRRDGDDFRLSFDANLGTQSMVTAKVYTEGYWDYLAALPALLPAEHLQVLVLGAAAATTERQIEKFWQGKRPFTFTSVELDGELAAIAETFFDPPARNLVTSDARAFVSSDKKTYDLIVLDVYTREITVPFHLATAEFFRLLEPRLNSSGILAINLNAASPESLWIRSIARTVKTVFPHVRLVAIPDSCNYLVLASRQPATDTIATAQIPDAVRPLISVLVNAPMPDADGLLLTDNRAPTDLLGLQALSQNTSPSHACA